MSGDGPDARGHLLDSGDLLGRTNRLPEQLLEAAALADEAELPPPEPATRAVVVCAAGTGAIAGHGVAALLAARLDLPLIVVEDFVLPAFVGPGTLVLACSYRGATPETCAAADEAAERGARLVACTSGGELAGIAEAHGSPVVPLPGGLVPGRLAFGAMVAALLRTLERFGLLTGTTGEIAGAAEDLSGRRKVLGDAATHLARRIGRTFPLVHGVAGIGGVAARRFKAQVNLDAKSPAAYAVQPGLGHDELAGFGQAGDVTRQLLTLIRLHSDFDDPRAAPSLARGEALLREVVADVLDCHAAGRDRLAQLLDLVLLGDLVALRLAAQEGIDPGPAPALHEEPH